MKPIKSTVVYSVPHWNFCNVDKFDVGAVPSKQVCQFCIKTRDGYHCALYNKPLFANGNKIQKLDRCCDATVGLDNEIDVVEAPQAPTVPPKDLMKQTIALYKKTVNDLLAQGYPRAMAEQAAEQLIFR